MCEVTYNTNTVSCQKTHPLTYQITSWNGSM